MQSTVEETLRRPPEAWALVAAGIVWLAGGAAAGALAFALAVVPGALQLASGVAGVLIWDDPRARRTGALGALLGMLLTLPLAAVAGGLAALLCFVLSLAAFAAAGVMSLRETPEVAGVPSPEPSPRLSLEIAADDALLAIFDLMLPQSTDAEARRHVAELAAAETLFGAQGWLEKPASFHAAPAPFASVASVRRRVARTSYEHLSVASEYAPHPEEPGRERWLGYAPNATAHAWLLRHSDPARPWLICIHGYRMGHAAMDLPALRAAELRERFGLNVLLPVLPLHGPRRIGPLSGDGFFGADVVDMVHAEAQAMWDLRRWLGWIRSQGGGRIGVHGLSLGGYNAALLACLDADLACVVAGIPATDLAGLVWRHGPEHILRIAEERGFERDRAERVLRVVSPLALSPLVPAERRWIYGGNADQLVPADHVQRLIAHWGGSRTLWYEGAHLGFGLHAEPRHHLAEALRQAGLA
jgi:dienelactone hydrolase